METRRSFITKALAAATVPFLTRIEGQAAAMPPHIPLPEPVAPAEGTITYTPDGIPAYYQEYMDQRVKDIHDLISFNSPWSDTFIFFTDTHVLSNHRMAGRLMGYLMQRTAVNKVFFGGDVCSAFGGKDDIDRAIQLQAESYYPFIRPYGPLYNIKGNHDFTINKDRSDAPSSWTYSSQSARNIILGRSSIDHLVTNDDDPEACYYYVDNALQHIRYIVVDSCDEATPGDVAWGVKYHFGRRQAEWLANKAILTAPQGYALVMLTHIPPVSISRVENKDLCAFVTAAARRQDVQLFGTTFSFTRCKANLLFVLSGHMHEDMQTYHNGLLHLITSCDACYQDYRCSPFFQYSVIPPKTRGTIYEQTFDVVNIDREARRIDMLRIGGGYDRHFHLDNHVLGIGETITLHPSCLPQPHAWTSYNALGSTEKEQRWTILNDIVSIDAGGTVRALRSGEATVFAEDAHQHKEFFSIVVRF